MMMISLLLDSWLFLPKVASRASKLKITHTQVSMIKIVARSYAFYFQVFYVIEGAVNFKIHETSMILATGGMFMVPRGEYDFFPGFVFTDLCDPGNNYFIENICNRDARLFFTQARKLDMNDDEKVAKEMHDAETQRRRMSGRSSSVGVTPTKIRTP